MSRVAISSVATGDPSSVRISSYQQSRERRIIEHLSLSNFGSRETRKTIRIAGPNRETRELDDRCFSTAILNFRRTCDAGISVYKANKKQRSEEKHRKILGVRDMYIVKQERKRESETDFNRTRNRFVAPPLALLVRLLSLLSRPKSFSTA